MVHKTRFRQQALPHHRDHAALQFTSRESSLAEPAELAPVIMVQIGARGWTIEALHSACQMARAQRATVALVMMIPVQHVSWLGDELGYRGFNAKARAEYKDYLATVEDYGLEAVETQFQYATWVEGTVQAAEHVGASMVVAAVPGNPMPLLRRYQSWALRRQLQREGRVWIDPA